MTLSPRARLLAWSAVALVVFRVVDTGVYDLFVRRVPLVSLAADLRVTSLVLLAAAFVRSDVDMSLWRRRTTSASPPTSGSALAIVGVAFLLVIAIAEAKGVRHIALPRWEDRVAFVFTGALAEELLNRGLVLGSALAVWPHGHRAVVWSAVVFALQHLQYHGYALHPASLAQLAWTFPMGIFFALVAARTRCLAWTILLHVANNVVAMLV